jgi:pyruvate kinase
MQPQKAQRRTKIVATIGPATSTPDILRALIEAGATTFRLNFSHGTHEDHQRSIRLIRQISFELNQPVGILQDLQGPKIRLGRFETGSIVLDKGDRFILTSKQIPGTHEISSITYEPLADEVPEGAVILLDDGKVEMYVEKSIGWPVNYTVSRSSVGLCRTTKGSTFRVFTFRLKPSPIKTKKT